LNWFAVNWTAKLILHVKIHEITPEFIQRMRDKGFKDLSLEEYIQLKIRYGNKLK